MLFICSYYGKIYTSKKRANKDSKLAAANQAEFVDDVHKLIVEIIDPTNATQADAHPRP